MKPPGPLAVLPSTVVAVHLNYRSRAAQRGRTPAYPSYFLKPPSSLAGDGDPVLRPDGCELLTFEGEIALIIGRSTRAVEPGRGWDHVGWVTAANDLGLQDLRHADRGANVRSKGGDGFTPIGPRLLDAREVDPDRLRLRTWVNGEPVQDSDGDELLFGFDLLVADLSRSLTLAEGDIVLTGTPAGAAVLEPGDVVEVEVSGAGASTGRLTTPVRGAGPLPRWGAPPRVDDAERAAAHGRAAAAALTAAQQAALATLSTATLAAQLRRRGLTGCYVDGVRPTRPELPLVGTARTLRYLPLREDRFEDRGSGMNAQKRAVESLAPGEVLVIDARGDASAGTIGDILALRAAVRGAAGIVSDGALRDSAAVAALDLPVYSAGPHPAVLGRRHVPWDTDVPIACGGALVEPGDVMVGDADGVLVIPPGLVAGLIADAAEQERQERFITRQVAAGSGIDGLYPLGAAWREAYDREERP